MPSARTHRLRRSRGLLLAATLAPALAPAAAPGQERPKWELGAGGVFFTQPDYAGSDEYRFRALPFPWIVYRGDRLRLDRDSIQTRIFGAELVRLDVSAGGQVSVDSSDNDRRRGMQDLDWIAQVGPSLRFPVRGSDDGRHTLEVEVPLRVALAVATDNFSYEGLVSSPKVTYRYEPDAWRFEANAGLEFGNDAYNDYVYGVQPFFSTTERPAYDADGGYAGVRLAGGVSRYFGPFYVGVFTRYQYLGGATFADSPLVGSEHAFAGGIAIGWVWLSSSEKVPVGAAANIARRRAREQGANAGSSGQEASPAAAPSLPRDAATRAATPAAGAP